MDIETVSNLLSIMNKATTSNHIQVFVWVYVSISPGYILRGETAGLLLHVNLSGHSAQILSQMLFWESIFGWDLHLNWWTVSKAECPP